MPFSIQPSKSVVILGEDITKDDFLKIILEDGQILYVRTERIMDVPYFANYTFDQEFLPKAIEFGISGIVDEWYREAYLRYEHVRIRVRQKHGELFSKKGGLRGQLRTSLISSLYVYKERDGSHNLDIGYYVRVKAYCLGGEADVFDAHGSSDYRNHYWTYPSPIAAILPTTRSTIRKDPAA